VTGILEVEDPAAEARRYRIPDGHEEVLTERDNLNYLAPFARMMVGIVRPLPAVMEAFRSGGGVPYAEYDADFCEGQAEMNRVQFINLLGSEWLPAVPDVHARLLEDPPARCRLRDGLVEHRAGKRIPQSSRRRLRPRRVLDQAGASEPGRKRAGRPREVRGARRR